MIRSFLAGILIVCVFGAVMLGLLRASIAIGDYVGDRAASSMHAPTKTEPGN